MYGKPSDSFPNYIWNGPDDHWFALSIDAKDSTFHHGNDDTFEIDYYFHSPSDLSGKHNVSLQVAKSACEPFKPTDSQLLRTEITAPKDRDQGIQYIYKSKILARELDSMWFYADADGEANVPAKNTLVDPGIFTVFYLGSNSTGYEFCTLIAGITWPT